MKILLYIFKFLLLIIFSFTTFFYELNFFKPILQSNSLDLCLNLNGSSHFIMASLLWKNVKIIFLLFSILSILILSNMIIEKLFTTFINLFKYIIKKFSILKSCKRFYKKLPISHKQFSHSTQNEIKQDLSLFLGTSTNAYDDILIPEKGLYQNILITGAIGSGKTSSAMYPITKQLISYRANAPNEKLGMLILDVKGNYYSQVLEFSKLYNRQNDVISIQIGRKVQV